MWNQTIKLKNIELEDNKYWLEMLPSKDKALALFKLNFSDKSYEDIEYIIEDEELYNK